MNALQFCAEQTFEFVISKLTPGASVLDVGCGDGLATKLLIDFGFDVVALDSSDRAVEEAAKNGVAVVQHSLHDYEPGRQFDAIVCSRSLHHMRPMDIAAKKAGELLKSGGLILSDDFGPELADEATSLWLFGLKSVFEVDAGGAKIFGPKLEDGEIPANPMRAWHLHHVEKHNLVPSNEVVSELDKYFEKLEFSTVPYLYKLLASTVTYEQARKLQSWEQRASDANLIRAIGVRYVGRKSSV